VTTRISRRHFLKIVAGAGLATGLGASLTRRLRPDFASAQITETRVMMGAIVTLTVAAPNRRTAQHAVEATFAEMARLVDLFDHRRPRSPLARLNRERRLPAAPPELIDVLTVARHYGALTAGAFDVTIKPLWDALRAGETAVEPLHDLIDYRLLRVVDSSITLARSGMSVTLDGIAKGHVVDGGVATLRRLGFNHVLVEAGGDLVAHGQRGDGAPWRVGVAHPRQGATPLTSLSLTGCAAATSGDYAHAFSADYSQHHILDPRRGRSPAELASVTILAPTATDADALSTAVLVMGPEAGLALLERLPHVEGLLVTKEMARLPTAGFPGET